MANTIVGGLFGIDPTQYQQQKDAQANQQALQFAEMDPFQRATYGMARGGQQLGQAAQGLMGIQDPQLQKAAMAKQLSTQFDLTTPEGMKQYAQALAQQGAPDLAQLALARSQEMEAKTSEIDLKKAQALKAAMPGSKIGKMIEERDALAEKYGANDPRVAAIDQAIYKEGYIKPPKGKGGAGGDGAGGGGVDPDTGLQKPKLLGKAGAMIDAYGNPQGVAAMKKNNEEYKAFGDLANALDAINPDDVKNSQSVLGVDYTGSLKGVGGYFNADTAAAQSKVAAASLLKQIDSLPPGPASDKDMLAAKASFPGYGDAQKLQEWIDRTRNTVKNKMANYEEQFGFRQRGGKKTSLEPPTDTTPKKRFKLD